MSDLSTNAVSLISDESFSTFTAEWFEAVNNDKPLTPFFLGKNGSRINNVSFTRNDIVALLSTVGIQTVKVKFGIRDGAFTLILFAGDKSGKRISAYYTGKPQEEVLASNASEPVPSTLALEWIENWRKFDGDLNNSLFKTACSAEYLLGYTYTMRDLMDSLFQPSNKVGNYLLFDFVLHKAYFPGAEKEDQVTETFGMVLIQSDTEQTTLTDPDPNDVFYDLSAPCPPTC